MPGEIQISNVKWAISNIYSGQINAFLESPSPFKRSGFVEINEKKLNRTDCTSRVSSVALQVGALSRNYIITEVVSERRVSEKENAVEYNGIVDENENGKIDKNETTKVWIFIHNVFDLSSALNPDGSVNPCPKKAISSLAINDESKTSVLEKMKEDAPIYKQ